MTAPTVLCADAAADIRGLFRATLASERIRVVLAASGAEAIEAARRVRPDAILLDIHLPIMDGLGALGWIKARAELARIPVVMITSDSEAANVQEAIALGARDFVVKPFESADLRRRVRRHLGLDEPALPRAAPATPDPVAAAPDPAGPPRLLLVAD